MFKKILIANRGEIAVRIIRAAKEMNIETVVIYSEADRNMPAVKMADQAVFIGKSPLTESYLNYQRVLSAALASGAEAVHPGYGLFAENADFAEACIALGLKFIGPSPDVILNMGDKTIARELMKKGGIPVVPGTDKPIKEEELKQVAKEIGFPIMMKAAVGGGGKGMRIINDEKELLHVYPMAVEEARKSFGDSRIFLEKYISKVKHIEVQIISDKYGNHVHLYERDCSLQRRHQKVVEEAPALILTEDIRLELTAQAIEVAKLAGYDSVGTIEFLYDQDKKEFYFIEMNTRIQVEHPISEAITGIDLVKEQISIAAGNKLSFNQNEIKKEGHAIECRINAENPDNNFCPSPGKINKYWEPGGLGVRIDSGICSGIEITPFYDALLLKIITKGKNRQEALKKMEVALKECIVDGINTNINFLSRLLDNDEVVSGKYNTQTIANMLNGGKK